MSLLIMLVKGSLLILLALTAFAALAMFLGYEPQVAQSANCETTPVCLFTII